MFKVLIYQFQKYFLTFILSSLQNRNIFSFADKFLILKFTAFGTCLIMVLGWFELTLIYEGYWSVL